MKKNIFIILILAHTCLLNSQNQSIGLKTGLNRMNFQSENNFIDHSFNTRINGGLTYQYKFENKFQLGFELLYDQKGVKSVWKRTITDGTTGETFVIDQKTGYYNFEYISLPLKTGYSIGNTYSCFFNIGIAPSFLLKAEEIIPNFNNGSSAKNDYTGLVNKFDIYGILEIGLNYKMKRNYLLFTSLSFQQSFTTITNSNYFPDETIKHYGFNLSLGINYILEKNIKS